MNIVKALLKRSLFFLVKTNINCQENCAAITFDDGPHPEYTHKVLEVLDEFNAKATFFMVGENVLKYPEIAKKVIDKGHVVANHSITHPEFKLIELTKIKEEIAGMQKILSTMIRPFKYYRPPKGVISIKVLIASMLNGVKIVLWSKDPKDYAASSTEEIVNYFEINSIRPGDIVLLHDKSEHTVNALKIILRSLSDNNIKPVSIKEEML